MPKRYDIYGFRTLCSEDAASMIHGALGWELTRRYSSYYPDGEYLDYSVSTGKGLMLYVNYNKVESEWMHEEYKEFPVILLVNDMENMEDIHRKLVTGRAEPVLLSSKRLPDEDSEEDSDDPEEA